MKEINIFCFGFGQVAKNFIDKINSENILINLNVTSREKTQKKKFKKLNYNSYQFTEKYFDQSLIDKLENSEYILVSISPVNGIDIVVNNFKKLFNNKYHKWITYLSATSVYGDHKGEWVNENSMTKPTSNMGVNRLQAENSWMNLADRNNLPLQIFRLSGIYSNEKNILSRLKSGNEKIICKNNHFFSRIHVEDIANILFESLKNFKSKEIYNISDDKPASSKEVALYGSKILNIKTPESIDASSIESSALRNFYKDSKKVSNDKMKAFFNYKLKYSTYVEGLNSIKNNFI